MITINYLTKLLILFAVTFVCTVLVVVLQLRYKNQELVSPVLIDSQNVAAANESKESKRVRITFYSWGDNSGTDIAYPVSVYPTVHDEAGGTGTYNDPVTFAANSNSMIGEKLYIPYLRKYAVKEDLCGDCGENHIAVWMNSDGRYNNSVISCGEYWSREDQRVIVNPPPDLEVDTQPLFNIDNHQCLR